MKVSQIDNKKAVSNKKAVGQHQPAFTGFMAHKKAVPAHDTFVRGHKK